jgi:hypothetical protein
VKLVPSPPSSHRPPTRRTSTRRFVLGELDLSKVPVRRAGKGVSRMQLSHALKATSAVFDEPNLRDQPDLFGSVASTATAWRVLDSVDEPLLEQLKGGSGGGAGAGLAAPCGGRPTVAGGAVRRTHRAAARPDHSGMAHGYAGAGPAGTSPTRARRSACSKLTTAGATNPWPPIPHTGSWLSMSARGLTTGGPTLCEQIARTRAKVCLPRSCSISRPPSRRCSRQGRACSTTTRRDMLRDMTAVGPRRVVGGSTAWKHLRLHGR